MILFINACPRRESRTKILADYLLERLGDYEEINLSSSDLRPLDEESLKRRTELITEKNYNHAMFDYAKQFANADEIVIAAPFWDASFPAILKVYLENIYVTGIVSKYGSDGKPVGLCKADKLYYVTTAGGPYIPDYSFNYISSLAKNCFGIDQSFLIKAEMLDVDGFDPEEILDRAKKNIDDRFGK